MPLKLFVHTRMHIPFTIFFFSRALCLHACILDVLYINVAKQQSTWETKHAALIIGLFTLCAYTCMDLSLMPSYTFFCCCCEKLGKKMQFCLPRATFWLELYGSQHSKCMYAHLSRACAFCWATPCIWVLLCYSFHTNPPSVIKVEVE